MNEDYKISNRLTALETEVKNFEKRLSANCTKLDDIHKFIVGDLETEGIRSEVNTLKKSEKERKFGVRSINVTVLGLAIKAVWDSIIGR